MTYDYKQFYRRKLPHRHSPGTTLFVTFRLKDSIPTKVIEKWKDDRRFLDQECAKLPSADPNTSIIVQQLHEGFRRRWFRKFEDELHLEKGPVWLRDSRIAKIVANSLNHLNGKAYDLHAFCIMCNHVHSLFTPFLDEQSLIEVPGGPPRFESEDPTLGAIMKSLKGYTAREANRVLGRRGQFWEPESYDHEVRNAQEFFRIRRYILNNPVKAGLVTDWRDWRWSWAENI